MLETPLPEISEACDKTAAAGANPVQQKAISASAVATVDMLALALSRFGAWRAGASAMVERYRAVAFDLSTPKGYTELTKAIAEVRAPRFAAQNVSKASKSELAGISKAIGAEEAEIAAFLADTESRLVSLRDTHDEKVKAEKTEAKRLEEERVAKHQTGIATIRSFLGRCHGLTAARIALGIEQLTGQVYGDNWQEFAIPAASAQCETLEAMRKLHAHAVELEAEATRLEAQRAEQDMVAAEQAKAKRMLAEQAAELKRQADAFAAKQAESMRLEKLADEQRAAAAKPPAHIPEPSALPPPAPEPMMQDTHAGLSQALADSPNAHQHAIAGCAPPSELVVAPVANPIPAASEGDELAQCRAALADACTLLDRWIVSKCPKKHTAEHFAHVAKLREMGGLPRDPPSNQ